MLHFSVVQYDSLKVDPLYNITDVHFSYSKKAHKAIFLSFKVISQG